MTWSFYPSLMLWSLHLMLWSLLSLLNHLNSFWTSADWSNISSGIYKREFLFRLFCYYQYAEKNLIMLIWPFTKVNDREKSFFALFAKVYVLKMPKFWDFLNLRNFLLAKVSDLKVFQESFQLQFQDYVIL